MTRKLRRRKLMKKKQKLPKTTLQTLILSKSQFKKTTARTWVRDRGFKFAKLDEKTNTYRFRQLDPKRFQKKSFRTIAITKGVKAVIGRKKRILKKKSK